MDVLIEDRKLRKAYNNPKQLRRIYGKDNENLIVRRLQVLLHSQNLEVARSLHGALEKLKGDRSGSFSMRLANGCRLILRPAADPPPCKSDGGLDWRGITEVIVEGVTDYHGKTIR